MMKTNPIYAIAFITLSLASFITGFWVGADEKDEIENYFVSYVESTLQDSSNRTSNNLKMLVALKEGNEEAVIKILTASVKKGLREIPALGHPGVERLAKLSDPTENTKNLALEYQAKYCRDKCLGM